MLILCFIAWYFVGSFYVVKSMCWSMGTVSGGEILMAVGIFWIVWPIFAFLDFCVYISQPRRLGWLGKFLHRQFTCK